MPNRTGAMSFLPSGQLGADPMLGTKDPPAARQSSCEIVAQLC